MTKLYIAGPMSGHDEYNYPAFNAAQAKLERAGYEVINPARQGFGLTYPDYLALALADVFACEAIALLPGWERSPGVKAELALADALGKESSPIESWLILKAMRRAADAVTD
jgi:Domain of unknown function (DUF4406)